MPLMTTPGSRATATTVPSGSTAADPSSTPDRRVVFVAGSGRSGTSTFAGALQQLGLHVPTPEVVADTTNPKGFGEPQWVIDFHNRLLQRAVVDVSDARPQAWFDTGRLATLEPIRAELSGWLGEQFEHSDELLIKDPRLSWFLGLWRVGAVRCSATPCFVTLLRPPMEVVRSKHKAYGSRPGDINTTAAWINMLLHTERGTRGSQRMFIRYHDLLDDWTVATFRAGEELGLHSVQTAGANSIRRVHNFIDPSLRHMNLTWDDVDVPGWLRDLAEATWQQLNRLAESAGDTPDTHRTLDQLRAEYTERYSEAEAMTKSTTYAATRRSAARTAREIAEQGRRNPKPLVERIAHRIPHETRSRIPAGLRHRARRTIERVGRR